LVITQSAAIIDYLEDKYPERPLMPGTVTERARVRSFTQSITADIHPLNTIRVYRYLRDEEKVDFEGRRRWFHHWLSNGFQAMESLLDHPDTGAFCHGDTPTLMDVVLVPQVYNAEQYGLDLSSYPTIRRIYRTCLTLAAFQAAGPETQPDKMAHS
jgi:maleylacetoacetate isomerase